NAVEVSKEICVAFGEDAVT
ncbi:hypothetical protein EAI_12592, partial [Harpegnathos saltator]